MSNGAAPQTISVLLVEDSALDGRLLLEAIRSSMTAGEVVVQSVKTLGAAKAELKKFSFSCVLLDLGLPDGRGTGNVSALREIDKTAAIIVLTGLDDERSAAEALKLGAQDYLVKGETDGEKLMKLIRHAVQRNRQTIKLEVRRDNTFFDASHDHVTLLPNRSLFFDRARLQLAAARLSDDRFGVVALTVDGVEPAKQQYGAGVADELLQRITQLMSESLRASDTLARVDFRDFALLFQPQPEPAALRVKIDAMQDRITNLRLVGNCTVALQLRWGLSQRAGDESLEQLFEDAQRDATQLRSAAVETAAAASAVEPVPAAESATTLIDKWQPWADVSGRRWLGLSYSPEWEDGRPVFQASTDNVAEAVTLNLQAAGAVARQWRAWVPQGFDPALIALKVFSASLADPEFVSRFRRVFELQGVPSNRIQLDIEESAFKAKGGQLEALNALHAGGFVLCLEGDGSTDIALSDMARVPVSSYKLSQRFLSFLLEEGLQGPMRRFLMAVQGASQALGANLMAGAVDSREAVMALQLVGVPLMQGNAIATAATTDAAPALWAAPVKTL